MRMLTPSLGLLFFCGLASAPIAHTAPFEHDRVDLVTQTCRAASEESEYTLDYLRDLVHSSDPRRTVVRDGVGLPVVSDSAIALVTSDSICNLALTAYESALQRTKVGRTVYVYVIGDRYVVEDPSELMGEYGYLPVFTTSFEFVKAILR